MREVRVAFAFEEPRAMHIFKNSFVARLGDSRERVEISSSQIELCKHL